MNRFACSYTDASGARRSFWIEADNHAHAEVLLSELCMTARVDGELVDEGECETLMTVGRA